MVFFFFFFFRMVLNDNFLGFIWNTDSLCSSLLKITVMSKQSKTRKGKKRITFKEGKEK